MNKIVFKKSKTPSTICYLPSTNFGYSLIEMLISIAIFAVVAIVATQSLATGIKNSKKSDAIAKVRDNIDYTLSSMDRLLKNAQDISCQTPTKLTYIDEWGKPGKFECDDTNGKISSGSATIVDMTSPDVKVLCTNNTDPVFACPPAPNGVPKTVVISITAQDVKSLNGGDITEITSRTKILLRNYTLN